MDGRKDEWMKLDHYSQKLFDLGQVLRADLSVCHLFVIHSSSAFLSSGDDEKWSRSSPGSSLLSLSLSPWGELRFFGCVAARWSAVITSSRKYLKDFF